MSAVWDDLPTAAQAAAVPLGVFLGVVVIILLSAAVVRAVTGSSIGKSDDD